MRNDDYKFRRLNAIFEGDGTEIRRQFIYAGLLLTVFERFKGFVDTQVVGYFFSDIEAKDRTLKLRRGQEFNKLVREHGAGQPGQHNNKELRAAIRWFHDLGAVSKAELDQIERLYSLRNEIGHELLRIIADDGKSPINLLDVVLTFGVYVKVVRWWLKEPPSIQRWPRKDAKTLIGIELSRRIRCCCGRL